MLFFNLNLTLLAFKVVKSINSNIFIMLIVHLLIILYLLLDIIINY